jgi:DNA repair exonuclease SbcCD nuclease subunit
VGQADRARFVHLADVHLGCRQYGLPERAADFARAFDSAVRYCLDQQPDFVVIAGDLFDAKTIEPQTYAQAEAALAALGGAGIPVVAVEGNHERWYRRGDRSWLWQLSRQGHLRLLQQHDPETGRVDWRPWSASRGFGAYTDIGPLRIFGVEYLGARLRSVLPEVTRAAAEAPADGIQFRIGVLHTGVDDLLPFQHSGASLADLLPLRAVADYLALGHVHHAFELPDDEPWVFNPGSLEAHNVLEGLTGDAPGLAGAGQARGIFDVSVELSEPPSFEARFVDEVVEPRPFRRVLVAAQAPESFEALEAQTRQAVREVDPAADRPPVVELLIRGRLGFPRQDLDQPRLVALVEEWLQPLHVRLTLDLRAPQPAALPTKGTTRAQIERAVLAAVLAQALPDGPEVDPLVQAALGLKAGLLEGRSPEDLASLVEETLD